MLNTTSPADDFMSLLGDQNLFCDKTPISFKNNPPALAFTEKKIARAENPKFIISIKLLAIL